MILQVGRAGTPCRWYRRFKKLDIGRDFNIDCVVNSWQSWWAAIVDHQLVGFAGTYVEPEGLFLGPCGVIPSYRGRGLQRAFLRAREAYGRAQGFKTLIGATHVDNWHSANNFIRRGFVLDTERINDDPDFLYFKKVLK